MARDDVDRRPDGWPEWLDTTNHTGSHYPYYRLPRPDTVSLEMREIIETIPPSERRLDLAGAVEMVFGNRLLGNRTLLTGVRRTPWMAVPRDAGWAYHEVPAHGQETRSVDNVVSALEKRLYEEMRGYVSPDDVVGLLLSGGLDSRILSGILRQLELDGDVNSVRAFTWGIEECRDVAYARRVANSYDWSFERIPLDSDLLWANIKRTGKMGAEFAPYHLHGLPELRARDDVDVFLAGSYGNSIGRGEYAGDHVTELQSILPSKLNKYGVLPANVVSEFADTVSGDAYGYRQRVDRDVPYQYFELEQQMHYMRRGLQSCMTHVAERTPLYQLFTAPNVVELMWELKPASRGTGHYEALLRRLPGSLLSIPDAKKGLLGEDGDASRHDELAVRAHRYGTWLRDDLRGQIIDCIRNGPVIKLCNERALEMLLRVWPRASTTTMNHVDDLVSWLATLSVFVQEYDVSVPTPETALTDIVTATAGVSHATAYQTARGFVRE